MATLGSDNFNLGWIPNEDATRGRPNGLVRMDNLNLDEDGAVALTKGTELISGAQFASAPVNIFSQVFGSTKHRYVGLVNGTVVKSEGESGSFGTTVLTGGHLDTAYGSTLGQVLVCSGIHKKKDDGTYIRNLGLPTPEKPQVFLGDKYSLDVFETASLGVVEGTGGAGNAVTDEDTFRAVISAGGKDLTAIQAGVSDTHSTTDLFTLGVVVGDSSRTKLVRLECRVSTSSGEGSYYYEWDFFKDLSLLTKGLNQTITLTTTRDKFQRTGFDSGDLWASVSDIRIIIECAAVQDVSVNSLVIEGGRGALRGRYQYCQVMAYNNNTYEARSVASPFTDILSADHQTAKITPYIPSGFLAEGNEDETNKIYIYRRNLDIGGDFTLVAIRTDAGEFVDNVTDDESVEGIEGSNIDNRTANLFLEEIPNFVLDLVPNYFRRTVYVTVDKIKVSDIDNPDSIDSRFELDTSGELGEVNLWIAKISESSLLVGTTVDIYNITGTLQVLADGSTDVRIRALGINPAPISQAKTVYNSSIIYMSGDGWRILSGNSNQSLLGATSLLYEGNTRYTIAPVMIGGANTVNYSCVAARNKLFTSVTLAGGNARRCYVYDFIKQYWYPYYINPVALFKEEDGTILATFGDGGDFNLRKIDTGYFLDTSGTKQSIYLQTCYNDGQLPNNRKDTKVLKIYADSGNYPLSISVSVDGKINSWISLGTFYFNGPTIQNIKLSTTAANLGNSFALRITGAPPSFKFYYWTVEYDARPEQVNYIRVPPTNFGVPGRKRFYDLPFSLDARGNNFTVTPYLDGVAHGAETFGGSNTKDFYTLAFRNETIGHELGIDIQFEGNSVGEFYEMLTPRHTEPLPDLSRWFRIPFTNLGTPARKRFVRIALVIDTRGEEVIFTPLVDNNSLMSVGIRTTRKETFIYYVTTEVIGIDLGGTLDGGETPFEFYGWDQDETVTEALPAASKYIFACTDFGTASRKRFSRISFICNPRGGTISFEPILDGIRQGVKYFAGDRKQTFSYYYTEDKIFVDLCYEVRALTDEPFEFYEILKPEMLEILPEPVKYLRIPRNNLGTDARKRFFAFAIFINTRGHDVRFTPYIDGVALAETSIFNSTSESTRIHYFTSETIGHDIGGVLETVAGDTVDAFEFYGVNQDETVSEKVPGPAKYLVIPPENMGAAARKRVRTIPMVINTRGGSVTFTPSVDGVEYPASTFVTNEKRTVLHYFESDSFGIDYGGTLESDTPFEFYGFGQFENVQLLPVGKKFDQVGPVEYPRRAWLRRLRVRIVPTGNNFTYRIFDKDTQIGGAVVSCTPNIEKDYDISLAKGLQGSIFRIELQSTEVFHRYYVDVWCSISGDETEFDKQRLG